MNLGDFKDQVVKAFKKTELGYLDNIMIGRVSEQLILELIKSEVLKIEIK